MDKYVVDRMGSFPVLCFFCFVSSNLCLLYPMLPMSLDSPFFIASSVVPNVYSLYYW